jgi:hypothetical protein
VLATTPAAPTVVGDDAANTLTASHALGSSEILVSENGGTFVAYTGQIKVGNVARAPGYWKFKTRAATLRNESPAVNSPEFNIKKSTPAPPTLKTNTASNSLVASNPLGDSVVLVSENNSSFAPYQGPINVGSKIRPAGYWKFKIKAGEDRNESTIVNSPALPILSIKSPFQLIGIKATQLNKEVLVQWTATAETSVASYEIERSSDGYQFNVTGTTLSNGNTVSTDYNFLDKAPLPGNNYYKVKSIHKSGEVLFTKVVLVKIGNESESIHVYPNPIISTDAFIYSDNLAKGDYAVSLVSQTGQTISQKLITHAGGTFSYSVPVSANLSKGVYILKISGKQLAFTRKLLK